jgi:hypothetical protein
MPDWDMDAFTPPTLAESMAPLALRSLASV